MGMSMHVLGIKPPDDRWQKMRAVWEACEAAGINAPDEVVRFFEYRAPDPRGVIVELDPVAVSEYRAESSEGFDVDLSKLDPAITVIRFYNAY